MKGKNPSARKAQQQGGLLLRMASCLLALVVLVLAGAWLWSGSSGSLHTGIAWAQWLSPAMARSLSVGQVQGSLRKGGTIGELRWRQHGRVFIVSNVDVAWDAVSVLAARRLPVAHLKVAQVQMLAEGAEEETGIAAVAMQAKAATPVQSVALPIQVDVRQLQIDRVVVGADAEKVTASNIRGRYAYDGHDHRLDVASLHQGDGNYSGKARLRAVQPELDMQWQGVLESVLPGGGEKVHLEASGSVKGALQSLAVLANVSTVGGLAGPAPAPTVHLRATVQPWAALKLPNVDMQFSALNAQAFWPRAPQTLLSGSVVTAPAAQGESAVDMDIANSANGSLDQSRLPVQGLRAHAKVKEGRIQFEQMHARIGEGAVHAQAAYTWGGALNGRLEATLDRVDPKLLYSTLASDSVSGTIQANQKMADAIDFVARLRTAKAANTRYFPIDSLRAQGRLLHARQIRLATLDVRTSDGAIVTGQGVTYDVGSGAASGPLHAMAPGLEVNARLDGLARRSGMAHVSLEVTQADKAIAWLDGLPFNTSRVLRVLKGLSVYGQNLLDLAPAIPVLVEGGWENPNVSAQVDIQAVVRKIVANQAQKRLPQGLGEGKGRTTGRADPARALLDRLGEKLRKR